MIKQEPLVSIIVPIYNVETELRKCINSILNQTYRNIEVILVDDGSTDMCYAICDELKNIDNRIIVIHKKNEGLVCARQDGLRKSNGELIAYVDGDDWIEEDFIETLVTTQTKYNVDIVAAGFSRDIGNISEVFYNKFAPGFYSKEYLISKIYPKMLCFDDFFVFGICSYLWNKIFKREIIYEQQLSVTTTISIGEDSAVTFPALLKANSLAICENTSYHYYQKPFSMLKTVDSINKESLKVSSLDKYLRHTMGENAFFSILEPQIKRYIDSLNIIRCGKKNVKGAEQLFCLKPTDRVSILGAGTVGQNLYSLYESNKICKIVGWFDRDYEIYKTQGLDVMPIDRITEISFDKIVIASMLKTSIEEYKTELIKQNIPSSKILSF